MDIKTTFDKDFSVEQKEILEMPAKTKCHVEQTLNPLIEKQFEFIYGVKN